MANTNNSIFLKISIDGKDSVGVIRDLEQKLKTARKELSDLNLTGAETSKTATQIKALSTELDKLKSTGSGQSLSALRQEAKLLDLELGQLTVGTEKYRQKMIQLAQVKDQMGDLRQELKSLSPDERFKAISNAAIGLSASFTAVQGAMSLMGTESEEVQQALLKIQSSMLILNSLNEIAKSKDSVGIVARMLGYKSLSKEIDKTTTSTRTLDGANKASLVGWKAIRAGIIATGIGLFITLLSEVYNNWDKVTSFFKNTFPVFSKLGSIVTDIKVAFTGFFYGIIESIKPVGNVLADFGKLLFSALTLPVRTAYSAAQIFFNYIKNNPLNVENIKKSANDMANLFKNNATGIVDDLKKVQQGVENVQNSFSKGKEKGEGLANERILAAERRELQEQELKDLERSVQFIKAGSDKRLAVEKDIIQRKITLGKAGSEEVQQLEVDLFNKEEEIKDKNAEKAKANAEQRAKDLEESLKELKENRDENLSNAGDEFDNLQRVQNQIENEINLSYQRQLANLDKFNEEKKGKLLDEKLSITTDTTLSPDTRKAELERVNQELLQLENVYQQSVTKLQSDNLNARKILINNNEKDQLTAKEKQLNDGLKLIETNLKVEEELINNSGANDIEKQKQRDKAITDAKKLKAELEKGIEKDKNDIIEKFDKERTDNEKELLDQSSENIKQANERKIESIEEVNKAIQDADKVLLESQVALKDALINLYNEVANAVITLLSENSAEQIQALDESLSQTTNNLNTRKEAELTSLQNQHEQGLISKEQYEASKNAIEANYNRQSAAEKEKAENKKIEIERKLATIKKAAAVFEVGINIAKEVAKIKAAAAVIAANLKLLISQAALAFPASAIYAPAIAATTAALSGTLAQIPLTLAIGGAQIGAIAAMKGFQEGGDPGNPAEGNVIYITENSPVADLVKFERKKANGGKITEGTTSKADDVPILVSKDEYIVRASAVRNNFSAVKTINDNPNTKFRLMPENDLAGYQLKFADGGLAGGSIRLNNNGLVNTALNNLVINSDNPRTQELLEELIDKVDDNVNVNSQIRDKEYFSKVVANDVTRQQRLDDIVYQRSIFNNS